MPLAWFTENMVLWSAAVLSFLLLLGTPFVSRVLASRNRGAATRAAKVIVILVILDVVVMPLLILFTADRVDGRPCGLYLLFFSLFCYYSGKRVGAERGRRDVEERLDLSSFDNDIEVTDRLLESRLRFPLPEDVVTSIKTLSANRANTAGAAPGGESGQTVAKASEAGTTSLDQPSPASPAPAMEFGDLENDDEVEVFEVEVEEIDKA